MNQAPTHTRKAEWPEAKALYLKVLHYYYDREQPARAIPLALTLLRLLDRLDPSAATLPGNEYRAVIAELDGDLPAATRYREAVVGMLDELAATHRLVRAGISIGDYSDQLDLLAILYRRSGRLHEAKALIERSAAICKEAEVDFDGVDVQKDIARAIQRTARAVKKTPSKAIGSRRRLATGS